MINARAQNAYGVAHFAQQNHVPQVRWENVDIIGDFIKNQMAKKQLEMMDKNYELAKDQAAFAREKFGYDQERDKVKVSFHFRGNAGSYSGECRTIYSCRV